jgi:lycopene cyclase domain-containing protein
MTYGSFLIWFLGIPVILLLLSGFIRWRNRSLPAELRNMPPWVVWMAHVIIAVVYTTPWDNYLVANQVWYYDPAFVTGILIGWVPIEEYLFFILQTTLTSLLLFHLARNLPTPHKTSSSQPGAVTHLAKVGRVLRLVILSLFSLLWLLSALSLALGWQPGVYLALLLVWALPPIGLQILFGADFLLRYRRLLGLSISIPTLYLSLADALAIWHGTWTIHPGQSLNIFLGGVLPLEELIFFLVTNTMIVFGVFLFTLRASRRRFETCIARFPTPGSIARLWNRFPDLPQPHND